MKSLSVFQNITRRESRNRPLLIQALYSYRKYFVCWYYYLAPRVGGKKNSHGWMVFAPPGPHFPILHWLWQGGTRNSRALHLEAEVQAETSR